MTAGDSGYNLLSVAGLFSGRQSLDVEITLPTLSTYTVSNPPPAIIAIELQNLPKFMAKVIRSMGDVTSILAPSDEHDVGNWLISACCRVQPAGSLKFCIQLNHLLRQ